MKYLFLWLVTIAGCGYEQRNSEMIGQVKKVYKRTPLICSDWNGADISLGVIRNGVGSMSSEDNDVYVQSDKDFEVLRKASQDGKLVKINYDKRRVTLCVPDRWVTGVEVLP